MSYQDFIMQKRREAKPAGFITDLSGTPMFPFQQATVEWACKLGRAAIFADTGLGKTIMQLLWAHEVVRETGRPVLLLTPLAVAEQTVREAVKFDVSNVVHVQDGSQVDGCGIYVTNYERLHHFDPDAFGGVVLDESSILKNVAGRTRNRLIAAFQQTPYRLCCTATPAPNDYTELGNTSEFLGVMDEAIMRARWFINDLSETVAPWRLKKHAEDDFWRWVTSWARCIGKPSDMGDYSDDGYILPPLHIKQHRVSVDLTEDRGDGMLFRVPELSATSVHAEKKRTVNDRARRVAELVAAEPHEPWVVWCETNYEQDALMAVLPHAIDVRGNMKPEEKAEKLLRFTDDGGVVVTKPKIAGMGLNWQHAARVAFVGGSYSYEAFYQSVRRCWRFGQARPVDCHVIMAATEAAMWHAINRKSGDHERMKVKMYAASRRAARSFTNRDPYNPTCYAPRPKWLHTMEMP
jgi:superfamily II DNA or RNA helicase